MRVPASFDKVNKEVDGGIGSGSDFTKNFRWQAGFGQVPKRREHVGDKNHRASGFRVGS